MSIHYFSAGRMSDVLCHTHFFFSIWSAVGAVCSLCSVQCNAEWPTSEILKYRSNVLFHFFIFAVLKAEMCNLFAQRNA